ncbi:unnamed protein product [Cuscuta campestris]|uniref:Uncharacterized protein n=1 Tax=Cuscuta campestris TaxID=132261 RepID=A0A484KAF8_9ASTE|nr:unnamed protein product [Cuscuta campestris]
MPLIEAGILCRVHNGQMTRFWLDTWIGEKPLCDLVQEFGSGHDPHATVAELWNGSRGWSWEKIPNLPPNIISFMQCWVMELDTNTPDEFYWKHDPTGKFSIKSAYNLIRGFANNVQEEVWSMIWKIKVPSKMKLLLWTICHEKVMGNAERKKRRLTSDSSCPLCGNDETTSHIFKTCPKARQIWNFIDNGGMGCNGDHTEMRRWVGDNLRRKRGSHDNNNWAATFAVTCWWIWRWRNNVAFGGDDLDTQYKVAWIKGSIAEIERAFDKNQVSTPSLMNTRDPLLKWNPAVDHEFTLNVDGSNKVMANRAGCGGVIRNNRGEWLGGFSYRTRPNNIEEIEAKAIEKGIQWAWGRGVRDLEVQCDAREVVNWIITSTSLRGPISDTIIAIKSWTDRFHKISFRAIFREQNKVADRLANLGAFQDISWRTFEVPTADLETLSTDDMMRVTTTRHATTTSRGY